VMRVLHVQKVTGIGGAERHLLDLLSGLRSRNVDVQMVTLTAGEGGRFVEAARGRGVQVTAIPAGPDVNPAAIARLTQQIRRLRPSLVHTHLIHADVQGGLAAALARTRTVSSAHSTHAFFRRPLIRRVERAAQQRAVRVIAISHWVKQFLRKLDLAPLDRVRVVYYGVAADHWTPGPGARERARQAFGVSGHEVVVGATSRLVSGKGHETLLRALATNRAESLRLLVAGDGPTRPKLEAMTAHLGLSDRVRFVGFLDDVRWLLHASDLFVFPTLATLSEGFGLAALEAQAAGLPVVASRTASLPEVIEDGGSGILIDPGSVDELARAIRDLGRGSARRRAMGLAGQDRARRLFSLDSMVDKTLEVYREVLAR
jgi:glycosyltransferase involved in cell wall biosynthesis